MFGANSAAKHPDRTALVFLGARFTYRRLRELVDRFAAALHALGVGRQDRVMLYLSNCPQWVIANFAVQRLGAVVVPVSPIYTSHELEYMIEDAGVETVVCQDTNFGYVHVAYGRPDEEPGPVVIGRPLRSYRCLAVDPETLEPVPQGEVGELLVTSGFNIKSYWNKPEEERRKVEKNG